jgi:hypothetical protein
MPEPVKPKAPQIQILSNFIDITFYLQDMAIKHFKFLELRITKHSHF